MAELQDRWPDANTMWICQFPDCYDTCGITDVYCHEHEEMFLSFCTMDIDVPELVLEPPVTVEDLKCTTETVMDITCYDVLCSCNGAVHDLSIGSG